MHATAIVSATNTIPDTSVIRTAPSAVMSNVLQLYVLLVPGQQLLHDARHAAHVARDAGATLSASIMYACDPASRLWASHAVM